MAGILDDLGGDDFKLCVVLAAAGGSTRYGRALRATGHATGLGDDAGDAVRHKLDEDLGGRPVLHRAIELFAGLDDTHALLVAGPADDAAFDSFSLRHADRIALLGGRLIRGGATHRWETVAAALAEIPDGITHVAVHDAARPVTERGMIERVLRAARTHAAVIPATPVTDTLKRAGEPLDEESSRADPIAAILGAGADGGATGVGDAGGGFGVRAIEGTVDRAGLFAVQTPQVFEFGLLRRAYAQNDLTATDDAQLVERLGERAVLVEGDPLNVKITVPSDLHVARAVLRLRQPDADGRDGLNVSDQRPTHKRF